MFQAHAINGQIVLETTCAQKCLNGRNINPHNHSPAREMPCLQQLVAPQLVMAPGEDDWKRMPLEHSAWQLHRPGYIALLPTGGALVWGTGDYRLKLLSLRADGLTCPQTCTRTGTAIVGYCRDRRGELFFSSRPDGVTWHGGREWGG